MKTILTKIGILGVVFGLMISFNSCTKKRDKVEQTAKDYGIAEIIFNDIVNQVDKAIKMTFSGNKNNNNSCPLITLTPTVPEATFPKTVTIDFGSGCTGPNGVIRAGIITATISGKYSEPGTIVNVALKNYTRNGFSVKGEQTITNAGKNAYSNTIYNIVVTDAIINTNEGTISWSSIQKREWLLGEDTPWPELIDDVFRTTGLVKGVNTEGESFKGNILLPLKSDFNCRFITEGSVNLKVDDLPGQTLYYGSGACDDKAELTYNNKFFKVNLY
jgi:hypothetical protein